MTIKQQTALNYFENVIRKEKLSKTYKDWILNLIVSHIDSIKIIKNRFVINRDFYTLLIEYIKENHKQLFTRKKEVKLDNEFYKFFNRLKRKDYIHKSSTYYPKSLILTSINPNPFNLLNTNFQDIDTYHAAKTVFEKNLLQTPTLHGLYIYLRFYNSYLFTKQMLQSLHFHDILYLSKDKCAFILYYKLLMKTYSNNKIYSIIPIGSFVTKVLRMLRKELLATSDNTSVFLDTDEYEKILKIHKEKYLIDIPTNLIRAINKTYYGLSNSSVYSTLSSRTVSTVPLSLADVNTLFPNSVNTSLMEQEKILIKKRFKNYKDEDTDYSDDSLYQFDLYETIELEYLIKSKEEPKVKDIVRALEKLKKIRDTTSFKTKTIIYSYLIYLVQKLLIRKNSIGTFKNYVYTLNKHIFKMIEDLENIKQYEIQAIIQRIEDNNYTKNTVDTFNVVFKSFFSFINIEGFVIDVPSLLYPKSLILEVEVDKILHKIEEQHESINNIRQTKRSQLLLFQKKAIILLAFYSGLRKNELRTRLLKDIYFDNNKIYIDVNSQGLKKVGLKLKNKNAKRRVELLEDNQEHFKILKTWYELRIKQFDSSDTFLFLKNQGKKIYRKKIVDDKFFEELSSIIKNVTNRYTTFHSFRHSFATYRLKQILDKTGNDKSYDILELSIQMGHQTPQITLNSYIHYGIIELLT
jgi:integrase